MSETEFNVNLRDLQFVLFEQLGGDDLLALPPFREFSKDDFKMILDEAARFAKEVLAPANRPGDDIGSRYVSSEAGKPADVEMPAPIKEAWDAFRASGWICMNGGMEHGGQGLPTTVAVMAGELFTGANCSLALCALLTQGVIHILEKFAPAAMQEIYLPKLFAGEWTGTMVLTEAGAGSDVGASKTKARKAADGDHYYISGEKIFITYGEHDMADNIVHLVLARTEDAPAGTKGLSLFVVPKFRVGADGSLGEFNDVRCAGIEHKMGIHASPTCTMSFGEDDDCQGFLLGREGDGIRVMFHMMNEARIDCGFQGSAQASAAFLNALSYAQQRVQGTAITAGKDPNAPKVTIDQHPDVRRMLLSMKAYVEGMRALLITTARYHDLSEHAEDEAVRAEAKARLDLLTPICKAHCSDMGFQVCHTAVQAYGGYGYLRDYPVEQYLRDVRIAAIYEGANGIQAMDLLGRKLPMQGGKVFQSWLGEAMGLAKELEGDEALGAVATSLGVAAGALGKAAMHLATLARERVDEAFLHATPFLQAMGDVAIGHQLLLQARIAHGKLADLVGATPTRQAIADSPEATFYAGKIESARWFAANVLPVRAAEATVLTSGDRSPLDVTFEPRV